MKEKYCSVEKCYYQFLRTHKHFENGQVMFSGIISETRFTKKQLANSFNELANILDLETAEKIEKILAKDDKK